MELTTKKKLLLEGLCCGNCAAKIERDVNKLNGVATANVDFVTKTLSLEVESTVNCDEILNKASDIVKKHEPNIKIREKEKSARGRKIINFSGLHCADCAIKIEKEVNKIEGVKAASLDFVSQKLTIDAVNKHDLPNIVQQATKIAAAIEPGIEIANMNKAKDTTPDENKKVWIERIALGLGTVIFILALIFKFSYWVEFSLFLASYLLVGHEVILRSLKNITKGQVFDENFLMSVATIGAFAIGDFPEGVAVMLFYQVGEFFQSMAVNRSRKSITALMDIRPDFANLKIGDEIRKVSPDDIGIGDIIIVKPGEKVPLDGIVIDGKSTLDTSALTGESIPRDIEVGNEALSGSINKNG
ncbi:MAG TPA: cation transporter, partial [Clostridia bacterium]